MVRGFLTWPVVALVILCSLSAAHGDERQTAPGSGESFRDCRADGQPCPMCTSSRACRAIHDGIAAGRVRAAGGETPIRVSISAPFAVGKSAVTFDEWDACVADNDCNQYRPKRLGVGPRQSTGDQYHWDDAKAYVVWLSAKTGKSYRLLTETEREYVARAGTNTPFWWGTSISTAQANYNGNHTYLGGGARGEYRMPVDGLAANAWGLHHVHGNIWEWTEDCWNDSNMGNPGDGSARSAADCSRRVVRGGSFYNIPSWVRAARRHWFSTIIRNPVIGFRIARSLGS